MLQLKKNETNLVLFDPNMPNNKPLWVNFNNRQLQRRCQKHLLSSELLIKAIGYKSNQPLTIIDATAGLGQDSFLMAHANCQITLLEQHPIVAALLKNGLQRAIVDPTLKPIIARMTLYIIDAKHYLSQLLHYQCPDIIYLDPMFAVDNKTAKSKKNMQLLQQLFMQSKIKSNNNSELLTIAITKAKKRVVVKRPIKSPALNHLTPDFSLKGRSNRFDVYLNRH